MCLFWGRKTATNNTIVVEPSVRVLFPQVLIVMVFPNMLVKHLFSWKQSVAHLAFKERILITIFLHDDLTYDFISDLGGFRVDLVHSIKLHQIQNIEVCLLHFVSEAFVHPFKLI